MSFRKFIYALFGRLTQFGPRIKRGLEEPVHPLDFAERSCDSDAKPSDARAKYDALVNMGRFENNPISGRSNTSIPAATERRDPTAQLPISNESLRRHFSEQLQNLEEGLSRIEHSLKTRGDGFIEELRLDSPDFAAWVHRNAKRLRQVGMNEKLFDPKRVAALNRLIAKNLLGTERTSTADHPEKVSKALETLKRQLDEAQKPSATITHPKQSAALAIREPAPFHAIAENALRWMTKSHRENDRDRETRATLLEQLKLGALATDPGLDKGVAQTKAALTMRVFRHIRDAKELRRWIDTRTSTVSSVDEAGPDPALISTRAVLKIAEESLKQFHDDFLKDFDLRLKDVKPRVLDETEATLDAAITAQLFDTVFRAWFESIWKEPRQRWKDFRNRLAKRETRGLAGYELESVWQKREARHNLALGAAIRSISPEGDTVFRPDVSLKLIVASRKDGLTS